jgi:hypothetical protein
VPITALTIGPMHILTQNVIYALPARITRVHSVVAVEVSVDGVAWDALTGAETTGAEQGAGFIRCATANTVVMCSGA